MTKAWDETWGPMPPEVKALRDRLMPRLTTLFFMEPEKAENGSWYVDVRTDNSPLRAEKGIQQRLWFDTYKEAWNEYKKQMLASGQMELEEAGRFGRLD